jgi:D-alanyl-lipoteichoic acid acyltransferase DltB (MBOAT superfamily)
LLVSSLAANPEKNIPLHSGAFVLLVVQLGLVLAVGHLFLIEQTYGFDRLIPIIFAGFIVHAWLPAHWRGWFLVLLFPFGAIALLGFVPGMTLISLGIGLFLLCHLPINLWARAGLLLVALVCLAAIRAGAIELPFSNVQRYFQTQTLPILSAMFMFRAAVYLYDLRHEKGTVPHSQRLGYFFLFPNICFPLFPVIDYQTFKRTYFARDHAQIYQKGIDWILRGIIHLLLYRVVYHYFVPDPLAIDDLAGVGQYVLSSFLLYLRVSGLFHLIIGIVCLFGYDLPETHHRYYLAESFTDFWRRINIYWKDFMVKLFYFPMFMSLRRWGTTRAMIVATLATFFITWLLHSYQWFWLRGTFPLHPQDMIFWGVLAILVTGNSIYEEKHGRKRRSLAKNARPDLRQALGRSVRTVSVFVVICLLWSFWTSTSIDQWLAVVSIANTASASELVAVIILLLLAVAIGVLVQLVGGGTSPNRERVAVSIPHRAARVATAALVLLAIANPGLSDQFDPRAEAVIATITGDQVNIRDQQQLVKGYYEELLGAESSGRMAWSVRIQEPATWRMNGNPESDNRIYTYDMRYAVMRPHIEAIDKGEEFTTNQWGMRDKAYEKEKPAGTYRIAMLGSSYTVGAGVPMERTFSSLVEQRLNTVDANSAYDRSEILNFAQAGYSILRRQALFEMNALDFDIDLVVDMSSSGEAHLAIRNLRAVVKDKIPNVDPILLDIVRRAAVTSEMSDEVIETRLGPYSGEILRWGYRQLSIKAKQHGVEALVFVLPTTTDTEAAFREDWEVLSQIARESGLTAVSLEGVYGPPNDRHALRLAPWDTHPNVKGHALLAERIYREFMNLGYMSRKKVSADSPASRAAIDNE